MLFGEYLCQISCKCLSQVRTCPDYCEMKFIVSNKQPIIIGGENETGRT